MEIGIAAASANRLLAVHRDAGQRLAVGFQPKSAPGFGLARFLLSNAAFRLQLLHLVERFQCLVLRGACGSRKSTQLPRFLAEAGWAGTWLRARSLAGTLRSFFARN